VCVGGGGGVGWENHCRKNPRYYEVPNRLIIVVMVINVGGTCRMHEGDETRMLIKYLSTKMNRKYRFENFGIDLIIMLT
jgi:hypothetical protein